MRPNPYNAEKRRKELEKKKKKEDKKLKKSILKEEKENGAHESGTEDTQEPGDEA